LSTLWAQAPHICLSKKTSFSSRQGGVQQILQRQFRACTSAFHRSSFLSSTSITPLIVSSAQNVTTRLEGAESSLTENVTSPFPAEPRQNLQSLEARFAEERMALSDAMKILRGIKKDKLNLA